MENEVVSVKIPCKTCSNWTNHKKEWSKEEKINIEDGFFSTTYEVLSCLGCGTITFRTVAVDSDDWEEDDEGQTELVPTVSYYPKRDSRMIKILPEIWTVPTKVKKVYEETIESYNNGLPILCAIGIRATIEAICLNEGVEAETLDDKIRQLISRGIVGSKLGEGLQENRLLGNESAHNLESFGDRELLAGIKLIENVIESYYLAQRKIDILKKRKSN